MPQGSRRQRWARVRRTVWQPPRPHGEAPRDRVVGPLELFYDLVVVVLVAQAAHHLAGDLPVSGMTLALGLVSVVVGFGAWWTYFDFTGQRRPRSERRASLRWVLGHLPLTAAVAAMGAAMVSLLDHAHDDRAPAATAWMLCAGAAVVLCATMLVATSLPDWDRDHGLYQPLARICAAVATACLVVAAARPAPLVLGLALILVFSIPWVFAVTRRLAGEDRSPARLAEGTRLAEGAGPEPSAGADGG